MSGRAEEKKREPALVDLDSYLEQHYDQGIVTTNQGQREVSARIIAQAISEFEPNEIDRAIRTTQMVLELEK